MKYYKSKTDNRRKLRNLRIAALPDKERKRYKLKIALSALGVVLFFVLLTAILILAKSMRNLIDNKILASVLSVITYILLIPLPAVVSIGLVSLVYNKIPEVQLPPVTSEMIASANQNKIGFYNLSDDFIITKCYDSSQADVVNRDVIISYVCGKIKITNDFYHSISDFGCYEYDLNEIEPKNIKDGNLIKTEINSFGRRFVFGHQAKTFIEKCGQADYGKKPLLQKALLLSKEKRHAEAFEIYAELYKKDASATNCFNLMQCAVYCDKRDIEKQTFERLKNYVPKKKEPMELSGSFVRYYYALALCDNKRNAEAVEFLDYLIDVISHYNVTDSTFLYIRGVPNAGMLLDLIEKTFIIDDSKTEEYKKKLFSVIDNETKEELKANGIS